MSSKTANIELTENDYRALRYAAVAARDALNLSWTVGNHAPTIHNTDGTSETWNPLVNSAQAFKLSQLLFIGIEYISSQNGTTRGVHCSPQGRGDCGVTLLEPVTKDNLEGLVCKAIVAAAEELGMTCSAKGFEVFASDPL